MEIYLGRTWGIKVLKLRGHMFPDEGPVLQRYLDHLLEESDEFIWDLSEVAEGNFRKTVHVLVEGIARVRMKRLPVVVLSPPDALRAVLKELGVWDVLLVAEEEKEALIHLFEKMEKRYDDLFFEMLVREGYVEKDTLEEVLKEYHESGGKIPIDQLLLERGYVTVDDIIEVMARRRSFLGEILVEYGYITRGQLEFILDEQSRTGEKLGTLLKKYGYVSEEELLDAIALQYKKKLEIADRSRKGLSERELFNYLASNNYVVVFDAMERIVESGNVAAVCAELEREDIATTRYLLRILGSMQEKSAAHAVIPFLDSHDDHVVDEALWALVRLTGQAIPPSRSGKWRRWVKWNLPSSIPERVTVHDPGVDTDEEFFDLIFDGTISPSQVIVTYETGKMEWQGGKTSLLLTLEGEGVVKKNTRGAVELTRGQVPEFQSRELVEILQQTKFWTLHSRAAEVEVSEPRTELALQVPGKYRRAVFYRPTEMYGNIALMRIENMIKLVIKMLG